MIRATLLFAATMGTCRVPAPSPPPAPEVLEAGVVDAAPEVAPVVTACGLACTNIGRLGCPVADNCVVACEGVEGTHYLTLNPGALAACADVACLRRWGVACDNLGR